MLYRTVFQVRKLLSSPLAAVKVELSVPVGLATEQGNSVLLDIADSQLGGSVEGGTRTCRVSHTPRPAQPSPSTPNLDCSVAGVLCSKVVCGPFPLKTNRTAPTLVVVLVPRPGLATIFPGQVSLATTATVSAPGLESLLAPWDSRPDTAVFITVLETVEVGQAGLPVWQLALSVSASLLILLLIVCCLVWKTNFFKRTAEEKKSEVTVKAEFEQAAAANSGEASTLISSGDEQL